MFRKNRPTLGLVPLLLFLSAALLAGTAVADPRVKPGAGAIEMIGYVIDDIDATASTITVSGETHHVTERSRLLDAAGRRLRLRDLRGADSHGAADMVKLETRRSGASGRSEILELRIVDLGRP